MELLSQTNTFVGGMNLDSDVSILSENQYRSAQNVRLLTDEEGTTGALQNIESIRKYEGGLNNNETILGTAVSRWYNTTKKKVEECGIVITKVFIDTGYYNKLWVVTNFESIKPTWKTIFVAKLGITDKVSIVTNYESINTSNVYFTGGDDSTIKVVNIQKEYNQVIEDSNYFDILQSAVLLPFELQSFTNGQLKAGFVQYCYQLFTLHGSESTLSSMSKMILINSDNSTNINTVSGDEKEATTGKGCVIKANILNTSLFNRLRIIRVYYKDNTSIPEIKVINEIQIANKVNQTVEYTDDGASAIRTLTAEEFNNIIPNEFSAKSITKLNGRLFASNLQELTWDINYDARAYRCNPQGTVKLNSSADNNIETTLNNILSSQSGLIIAKDHDCINPMNGVITYPSNSSEEYAYGYETKSTGEYQIRGGRGLNVAYRFCTMDLLESADAPTEYTDGLFHTSGVAYKLSINSTNPNTTTAVKLYCPENKEAISTKADWNATLRNYANPKIVSNCLGYQRDEIYRFGIVFYNAKGIASPVHWIGDIRFPSADVKGYEPFTFGGSVDGSGKYELVSHPLGIVFEVNNLPSEVKSYEIVRCNRTQIDRTIVAQGLLNRTLQFRGYTEGGGYDSQISFGYDDIRPCVIPTYTAGKQEDWGNVIPLVQGTLVNPGTENEQFFKYGDQRMHKLDDTGVFNFVSPDVSFNKEHITSLVKDNMYVTPLYCADSVTFANDIKQGIPVNGYSDGASGNNPFGYAYSQERGDPFQERPKTAAFVDGYPNEESIGTGGLMKYFRFSTKKFAQGVSTANELLNLPDTRYAFKIKSVLSPKNITPYLDDDLKEIKNYVQYIDNKQYVNYFVGSYDSYGPSGVSAVINVPDVYNTYKGVNLTTNALTASNIKFNSYATVLLCNIKNNVIPYGGNTYIARSNSNYISTGIVQLADVHKTECFGGDTYLGIYDHANSLMYTKNDSDRDNGQKRYVACYIPVESSVNVYLRNDKHFMQEAQGMNANVYYTTDPGTLGTKHSQTKPMYAYNVGFSAKPTARTFVDKNIYAEDNQMNMTRITSSEVKTNNELTDSWTKFKFANYLDVDSQYGQVTNLKTFKNRLYFFQDSAVGVASVNDRSLIQDNNAGELVLGTGGVLTRFDYLVVSNGDSIINDKSITNSETTLYWFDFDKNTICSLGEGFNELSKVKSVQTYLNRLPLKAKENPVSFYDKKYNEVWFKIYDRALVFNEQLNVFTSFYTHNPNWFFPFSQKLITVKDNNCYYLHNIYDIQSEQQEEKISKIEFVVNKDFAQTKVFDNQWFAADFVDIEEDHKQVKSITFKTRDQETDSIDFNNIENREDTYRFPISREKQENKDLQTQTNMSYAGRLRGKYLVCDYVFDCNNNREFKIPFIKTTYRYSLV